MVGDAGIEWTHGSAGKFEAQARKTERGRDLRPSGTPLPVVSHSALLEWRAPACSQKVDHGQNFVQTHGTRVTLEGSVPVFCYATARHGLTFFWQLRLARLFWGSNTIFHSPTSQYSLGLAFPYNYGLAYGIVCTQ